MSVCKTTKKEQSLFPIVNVALKVRLDCKMNEARRQVFKAVLMDLCKKKKMQVVE